MRRIHMLGPTDYLTEVPVSLIKFWLLGSDAARSILNPSTAYDPY
jgi:hypothetical protein